MVPTGVLSALLALLLGGCAATAPPALPETGPLKPGQAALFIAVPFAAPEGGRASLELTVEGAGSLFLRGRSLNRIAVPAGWHRLLLPRLPQPEDNTRTAWHFEEGSTSTFSLLARPHGPDSSLTYSLVPISRSGMARLLEERELSVVDARF
jgi:hypothetical protein